MSEADKITIKPFKFTSMKGFTKEENDYFWNRIKEKSITINIDSNITANADKSLEELGYKLDDINEHRIKYKKDDDNVYYFYINQKEYCKSGEYDGMCGNVTINELQAINQKVKELGWV